MADTKMSALPVAAALAGADEFAINQGGVSKRASATQIATFTGGAGSAPPFTDATAIIMGSADNTKLLRIEVDGFTAGATRILTPPNANATIAGLQIAQTFTEVQTFTPADNLIPIVIAAGSVTGAGTSPFLNISGTWNTTGAPDAIRLTITDTASNAASNLIDLMVGAGSMFAVRKDGRATIAADALIAGAASPSITSIRVSVGAAAAQNVIRINGNSTADNAPVLDFLRSGNREWTMAPIGNSFFIGNSGGVANFNDATLNATPNWEFTSLGALKLNLGTVGTGLLHVNTNTSGAGLTIFEQASADTDDYDLSFRKARGTVAVPTVITVADQLGSILFRGYSGAGGYVTGASIRAVSTGTIASTRIPASLVFATGTNATPTVLTDAVTINNAQQLLISTGSTAAPGIAFSALASTGFYREGTGIRVVSSGVGVINLGSTEAQIASTMAYSFASGVVGNVTDLSLFRDAASTLAVRVSTTAQTVRVYETFTDASNYSRSTLTTQAGNHLFRTEAAGTGTLRILQVGTGPSTGTDIAGVSTIIHGGQSTGTGVRGAILFQQSPPGGAGAGVNALATIWSIDTAGNLVHNEGGGYLSWASFSKMRSTTDGNLLLSTNGGGSWNLLLFGGTTSSFPALKRSSATLQVKLADDSAFAAFSALDITANAGTAIPAGGTAGAGLKVSSTANFGVFFGSGAPSLVAAKGSLYMRSDGSGTGDRCYVATDSAGAWTAITTAT